MTDRVRVALLFGGRSSEHSISCATAAGVLAAIDRDAYEVLPIGITHDGAFTLQPDDAAAFELNPERMPEVEDNGSRVLWPESAATRELTLVAADGRRSSLGDLDLVFPILHGPWGEDGTLQGMLELVGLPYVGSGVLASALGMDKHFTKTVLQQAGIPVAPWTTVTAYEWRTGADAVRAAARELGLPAFVKPARAGSSVGVGKVKEWSELGPAMDAAFAEDDRVLIESGVVGREVEIAVLGGRPGESARASVAGEIVVSGRDFYDFAAKYLDAPGIDLVCPAELTDVELGQMRALGVRAFDAIGGEGLARVDFFLTSEGFVVNEINTMPGFTPISMFPRCWQETGLSYPELIDELIQVALARA
ncbi:D-alanine:D-alanine ligase [Leifsonia xyli subsp. cynodontis DSM 46306]|uniref:D-alanine--D-alanine ligase n=1 Tax=Leifsonia xyli subsp. cynodontis DSM 46306 TaxID=1389489 RepID=U3P853_LEIXC|nr:D-alanine--D-alanine ligase family protein [Leifsonia xyli]AGW41117.1 D-alanine:D-alanine ligase [Leifsonia xyli subsp. cynodontis DSM 46306]